MSRDRGDQTGFAAVRMVGLAVAASLIWAASVAAQPLTPDRVLLLYNSANAESLAVRDMYTAARPGVMEFDLNDPTLSPIDSDDEGRITRQEFLDKIRTPLLQFLDGTTASGVPLSEHIIAIATTRGMPARIEGSNEFALHSSFSSVESELVLVQQDLGAISGAAPFHTAFEGVIHNPYHFSVNQPIASFDRSGVTSPRSFNLVNNVAWQAPGLTPGDMYLVCRLDAAPSDDATALENIQALIDRAQSLTFSPSQAQALLDEYSDRFDQLDGDGGLFFPTEDDFSATAQVLISAGIQTLHDETFDFITGPELPDQTKPLIALGTYGENHDLNGWGENPPGVGAYIFTYDGLIHPACVFIAYESFNGNSIIDGTPRGGQGQALDFIALGGSFTVAHVAEPFTFTVADLRPLTQNLLLNGMTFAEAAYSAIPALSWQNTPVGDPLATVTLDDSPPPLGDLNGDGLVNGTDLAILLASWGGDGAASGADLNDDGVVDGADLALLLSNWTR